MFGVYHFASYYITFRNEIRAIYVDQTDKTPTEADLDKFIDTGLKSEVNDTGFIGYMRYAAKQGITVTPTTSTVTNEKATELKDGLAWGYWGIELLFAMVIAAGLAWQAAKQPFDENANAWYGLPQPIALAPRKSRKPLLRALKDGNFTDAGAMLTTQQIRYPRLEVAIRRSPDDASPDMILMVSYVQRQNRKTELKKGIVSSSELESLSRTIQRNVVSKT
jgi:hypothetical protein